MENLKINFAIVGSLSSNPGEAGIIRCDSEFLSDATSYKVYSELEPKPKVEGLQKKL